MRILALDLGLTTGWACVDERANVLGLGQIPYQDPEAFVNLVSHYKPDHVVVEPPVIIRGPLGEKLTGVITHVRSIIPGAVDVDPAQWKNSWWGDAEVPRASSQHEKDALRMAYWYLDTRLKTANVRTNVYGS